MSRSAGPSSVSAPSTLSRHPGWPGRVGPVAVAAGVVGLRPPRWRDAGAWSGIRSRDRERLEAWEPGAPGSWAERNSFSAWLHQCTALRRLARRGLSLPFMLTVDGRVAGQVTVGNVVRGSLCSAWVGYWVAAEKVGGGVATAAVAMAVDYCFSQAGLHRVEATVRPENAASLRVLAKLGFREEGLLRSYLDVAGDWRDHYLLAITAEEAAPGLVRRLTAQGRAQPA
jgi:ribosomal-protein-alanine N-acetyltransferase